MRAELADASLARYAGRFVWLELDFDNPKNAAFIAQRGMSYTPTFYVMDPENERVTASQIGAMTLPELIAFMERGMASAPTTPAGRALARGDELMAQDQAAEAATVYQSALRLGEKTWPDQERAIAGVTAALYMSKQWQRCAETAAAEAPAMSRTSNFGRVVLDGLACAEYGQSLPWAVAAKKALIPAAVEAIGLPSTVRDHRFKLYQVLIVDAQDHYDHKAARQWSEQWFAELDRTRPADNEERSALDIARVEATDLLGDPSRVLPALIESEREMPGNYNASLRVAQMEVMAKNYQQGIAACDRGLATVTGPVGRMVDGNQG